MNYEAKKIIVRPYNNDGSFILTPTFLCNIPTEVSLFEIDYAPNNNTNREKLKNYDKQKVLAIVIFFYSYLMITKYNWCFIYINENVDVIENLYGKNGNISTEYRIKKT